MVEWGEGMNNEEKIVLFNSLREELENIYGEFDTIEIVDEPIDDIDFEKGVGYRDTRGCMESVPVCIVVLSERIKGDKEGG